ncbi:MAG: phosphoglycerate kinase, partial [Chitinophagales bacterium]
MDFNKIDFKDKKVLLRVDFNVPLNDKYEITDDTRIRRSLPTIQHILKSEGSVIVMSHLGRPKNGPEDKFSMRHLLNHLEHLLHKDVLFSNGCVGSDANEKAASLRPGEVLLLENTRFYPGETKGDIEFAEKLASLGDIYINDAFGTAHRKHASTAVVADYFSADKKGFGLLMEAEINNAEKVISNPEKPFTAIIGGAKVSDKISIIENLLDKVDHLIIGGGMAYTFIRAKGGSTGNSLVEEDKIELAANLLKKAAEKGVEILLPEDSLVADKFDNNAKREIQPSDAIKAKGMGLDIGPKAMEAYSKVIQNSKTILWNGPMGVFEMSNFQRGTLSIAQAIAKATESGAFSLVGGGDSVAAVVKFGFENKVSYVSTGGGAMLEFFEG